MINTGKTYSSLEEALTILNTSTISKGERLVLSYYSGDDNIGIDILIAVGTKDGRGPGCYSIISTSSVQIVTFVTEVPDITELKNGQLYIWSDSETNKNYKIYLGDSGVRVKKDITEDLFVEDTLGVKYYVNSTDIKQFKNFITSYDLEKSGSTRFMTQSEYNVLPGSDKTTKGNIFVIYKKS